MLLPPGLMLYHAKKWPNWPFYFDLVFKVIGMFDSRKVCDVITHGLDLALPKNKTISLIKYIFTASNGIKKVYVQGSVTAAPLTFASVLPLVPPWPISWEGGRCDLTLAS